MPSNLKCGICLRYTSFKEGDYFVNTQCGHVYHYECIRDWICQDAKNAVCPSCRHDINLRSLVKLHGISPSEIRIHRKPASMKFVILGDSGCGKTCLLHQYANGTFIDDQNATIGCDLYFKNVAISGKVITLSIWDCGGQERFGAITPNYVRNANGVFLVYDISKKETFENLDKWLKLIYDYAPTTVSIILCGNKSDLAGIREVSKQQGEGLANDLGINFLETSAKEAHNVEAAFRTLTASTLEEMQRAGLAEGFELTELIPEHNDLRPHSTGSSCQC